MTALERLLGDSEYARGYNAALDTVEAGGWIEGVPMDALAAERRATVERIRAELEAIPTKEAFDSKYRPARRYLAIQREAVERILDEEAAR